MYSLYGSGHWLSSGHKATTLTTLVLSNTSVVLAKKKKKRLCPTEPFDLKEWILAAGVLFFFPSLISLLLTICHLFLQGNGTAPHYGIPSVMGWEVNKGSYMILLFK